MQEPTCQNCKHYRQHYIKFREGRFDPIQCGHCVYPRLKHRAPDTLACYNYKDKNQEQEQEEK